MRHSSHHLRYGAYSTMHMQSKKDLNAPELETVRTSRNPITVFTTDGEVQMNEEAKVYVTDLDVFVTVQLLEMTPPVLSPGQLCADHGYSCEWTGFQKPRLIENGRKIPFSTVNYVPFVVPVIAGSTSSSSTAPQPATSSSHDSTQEESMQSPVQGHSQWNRRTASGDLRHLHNRGRGQNSTRRLEAAGFARMVAGVH